MRTLQGRLLALAALALVACASRRSTDAGTTTGAGDGGVQHLADGAITNCTPGQYVCDGSRARQCDIHGVAGPAMDCGADAVCIGGLRACGACRPGNLRCNATDPNLPERCMEDGSGYEPQAACNPAIGQMCQAGACTDRCAQNVSSYLGCEYWSVPTVNSQLDPSFSFELVLSNPQDYVVHVTVEGGALAAPATRTVQPHSVSKVALPWVFALSQNSPMCYQDGSCLGSSAIGRADQGTGAYHITADGPIAAYQFNPLEYRVGSTFSFTADASLLLPQNVLTTNYIVSTPANWTAMGSTGGSTVLGGFIAIVGAGAPEASSTVNVTLKAAVKNPETGASVGPGRVSFTIHRGDVIELVGTRGGQDLTGSIVDADQPVAVFGGHDCTNIPADRSACDHLEEQTFPSATWGRTYAVSYLHDRIRTDPSEFSVVRVMAQVDDCTLTFDGIPTPAACNHALSKGAFCEFQSTANFQVTGTQPILVTQFMSGLGDNPVCAPSFPGQAPPDRPECVGDPAMVTEVPVEQYRDAYDFLTPDTYSANYVNVVAPTGSTISLDGAALTDHPVPVGTGLELHVVSIAGGSHHIDGGGARFGIKVYGVASYTSYMYPGGLDLVAINPPG